MTFLYAKLVDALSIKRNTHVHSIEYDPLTRSNASSPATQWNRSDTNAVAQKRQKGFIQKRFERNNGNYCYILFILISHSRATRPNSCSNVVAPSLTRIEQRPISYPSPASSSLTFKNSSRSVSLMGASFVTLKMVPIMSEAEYPSFHSRLIPARPPSMSPLAQLDTIFCATDGGGWSHTFRTFCPLTTSKPLAVA